MTETWLQADQTVLVIAFLVAAATIGIVGDRYRWFGNLSGILITILVTAILSTIHVIPSASDPSLDVPAYHFVYEFLVPISIPLLLFNVHLKKIVRESGRLLLLFLIGSFGVVIGAVLSFFLFPLGVESFKVAAVFIGTYTGGSVNFMAVASTLDFIQSPLFTTVATVDNVFTNLFFLLLFLLPAVAKLRNQYVPYIEDGEEKADAGTEKLTDKSASVLMEKLAVSLLISLLVVASGSQLNTLIQSYTEITVDLEILIITVLITIVANLFPSLLSKYESVAFQLGMIMMFVFLATIGAACDLSVMLSASPFILAFAAVTLGIHLCIILLVGKWLKFSLEEILIASIANAGGPSVAAPMAANFGMKKAVTPAILISILGYVIGTFLGVGTGLILS